MRPLQMPQLSSEDIARFWAKVDVRDNDSCWEWMAGRTNGGYGRFRMVPRHLRAHRVAYALMIGEIPDGLDIDHLCRNRACVNPRHLEPVTRGENTRRGEAPNIGEWQRSKEACPKGHAYTPENTYSPPSKPHTRECRACAVERQARRYRRNKDAA